MLFKTHLAFGLLAGLFILPYISVSNKFIFLSLVVLASLIPDIDKPNSKISRKIPVIPRILSIFARHRGIFHSVFIALLIFGVFWYFIDKTYGLALFAGYLSHLLIDGFTKQGVNLLHPVSQLRIAGPIETGKSMEYILLIIIIGLCLFKILYV